MNSIENNIWRYYLFSALVFFPVSLPVFVLFWQQNNLTLSDVYILQSIFAVSVVLLEIPAGIIADSMGKRKSLIYSNWFMLLGFLLYSFGQNFYIFLICEILIAIGVSLLSGADSALLFDTLKSLKRESEFKKIEGQTRSIQMLSFALCNFAGGIIGTYSYRATMFASLIGPFICLFIVYGFKEVLEVKKINIKDSMKDSISLLSESFRFIRKQKWVYWNVLFFSLISCASSWLLWLYQPYMEFTGLPLWFFGIAFASFNLCAAFVSNYAYRFESIIGKKNTIIIMFILMILCLSLMSNILLPISFSFIWLQQIVRGFYRPIITNNIFDFTYSDKRATVISLASMLGRLLFAITAPLIVFISGENNIINNIVTQLFLLAIFSVFLLIMYYKTPDKYFIVKDKVKNLR